MRAGDTPLLIGACLHGRLAEVRAILQGGANVSEPTTDSTGATPLLCARDH